MSLTFSWELHACTWLPDCYQENVNVPLAGSVDFFKEKQGQVKTFPVFFFQDSHIKLFALIYHEII